MTYNKLKRERVRNAAQMLDREVPGWERRVDPETLKMSSCANCVLGQVFGPKMEGKLWQLFPAKVRAAIRTIPPTTGYRKGLRHMVQRNVVRDNNCDSLIFRGGTFSADPDLRCMWIEEVAERSAAQKEGA